jgi:peptidoglycan/LPS O-acetylase OafA/YrhL
MPQKSSLSYARLVQGNNQVEGKGNAIMKERRFDIDWLRVFAILAVFIFHCTRFFGAESWHLKNPEQSMVVFVLTRGLIWPWLMELFFLLSGAGAWYALKTRKGGQYLWVRVKRLLIPLYTVGLFILIPPQVYFELTTNAGYTGNFVELLSLFFSRLPAELFDIFPRVLNDPARLIPFSFCGHLWFLQYLFLISLLTLPLLIFLKSERGRRWIDCLAGWCNRRGGIFLFVIPLALILIGFRWFFSGGRSWADFLWYSAFFVIGYIMVVDKRFIEIIKRHIWASLVIWLVGFFGFVAVLVLVLGYDPGQEPFSLMYVLYQTVWSVTAWSAVAFMLGVGAKYFNNSNKTLAYANEAVLPFYLLHQTVILCVGWFVIPWNLGILSKFLIILAASFVLIMVLYEILIKPFNLVRILFGMHSKKPSSVNIFGKEFRTA